MVSIGETPLSCKATIKFISGILREKSLANYHWMKFTKVCIDNIASSVISFMNSMSSCGIIRSMAIISACKAKTILQLPQKHSHNLSQQNSSPPYAQMHTLSHMKQWVVAAFIGFKMVQNSQAYKWGIKIGHLSFHPPNQASHNFRFTPIRATTISCNLVATY